MIKQALILLLGFILIIPFCPVIIIGFIAPIIQMYYNIGVHLFEKLEKKIKED